MSCRYRRKVIAYAADIVGISYRISYILQVHTDWITKILQPTAPFFKVVFGLSPGGAYVFLLGLLTGYPMGAKLTADLYYAGKISRQEAEYLLTFCNNPSPAFLITYVGHICLEGKLHIGFLVRILLLSDMI